MGWRSWPADRRRPGSYAARLARQEAAIGLRNALSQADAGLPAERIDAVDREQLARRAVGLAGVEANLPLEADDLHDQFRKFANRQILADANVEQTGFDARFHQEDAGIGHVVDMHELAQW